MSRLTEAQIPSPARWRTGVPLATVVLAALACGGVGVETPPPPLPVDPAPQPALPEVSGRRTLPVEDPFDTLSGFLAVAPDADRPWTPSRLAVPEVGRWGEVEPGAHFAALAAEGHVDATFVGVEDVTWCGATTRAPVFTTEPAVTGLVWITASAGEEEAVAPRPSRPPTADRRLYTLPLGGELDIQRGHTVVEMGGGRPWVDTWSGTGADLRSETEVGPSYPELAWTDADELWIGLRRHEPDAVKLMLLHIAERNGVIDGVVRLPEACTATSGVR